MSITVKVGEAKTHLSKLLAKVEAHYMDGSGMLFNTADHPQPLAARDNSWLMLDAKITFSF